MINNIVAVVIDKKTSIRLINRYHDDDDDDNDDPSLSSYMYI